LIFFSLNVAAVVITVSIINIVNTVSISTIIVNVDINIVFVVAYDVVNVIVVVFVVIAVSKMMTTIFTDSSVPALLRLLFPIGRSVQPLSLSPHLLPLLFRGPAVF